jgi:hypothetical protein
MRSARLRFFAAKAPHHEPLCVNSASAASLSASALVMMALKSWPASNFATRFDVKPGSTANAPR